MGAIGVALRREMVSSENEREPAELEKGVPCPACGAIHLGKSAVCWLCQEPLLTKDGQPRAPAVAGGERRERGSPWTFSLSSLFLLMTLISICMAVLVLSPPLGILLVVVATPAAARTILDGLRRKSRGAPFNLESKAWKFMESMAVVAVVGISSLITFVAICFPLGLGGVLSMSDQGIVCVIMGFAGGLIAAGFVAYRLLRRFW
jgi:hypothetical protein